MPDSAATSPHSGGPPKGSLRIPPWIPTFLVVLAAAAFRAGPWWTAILLAVLALAASIAAGLRWRHWSQTAYAAVALVLAALAGAVICAVLAVSDYLPWAWPCNVTCAGGGAYRHLGPINITWLALAGLTYLALLALGLPRGPLPRVADAAAAKIRSRKLARLHATTQTLGWALIGGSLFYLWTAWRLGMPCRQCLAAHTAILACAGPLLALPGFVTARISALSAGFLVLLALNGYDLRIDALTAPTPIPVAASESAWIDQVNAGRRRGDAAAPLTLAIVLDAQCQTCADTWPALDRALAPLVGAHRVQVVIRPLVRPSEPASAVLADCIDAAAADGPARHARVLRALLGSRAGMSASAAVATDAAQAIDARTLAATAARHAPALADLRADDAAWLAAVAPGTRGIVVTPFAVLSDATGHELHRWAGADLDPAAVAAAIAAAPTTATGSAPATAEHSPSASPSAPSPTPDHP